MENLDVSRRGTLDLLAIVRGDGRGRDRDKIAARG